VSSYSLDSIAPNTGTIWKPMVGEVIDGMITYVGDVINDDFDKKGKQREVRIDLETSGGKVTVYGTLASAVDPVTGDPLPDAYPSRLVTVVAEAIEKAGGSRKVGIETGARLQLQRIQDVATTRGQPAKAYAAVYTRPASTVSLAPVQSIVAPPAPAQVIQSQPMVHAQALDYGAISAATGVPEAALRVMTAEQIASLPSAAPAQSAPSAVQALSGLLSQPNG
jgi:hypothetical protein